MLATFFEKLFIQYNNYFIDDIYAGLHKVPTNDSVKLSELKL